MRIPIALVCLTACAGVDDGAVEMSWTFRPASSSLPDMFVGCDANGEAGSHPVATMELDWNVNGIEGSRQWPCDNSTGATSFEVPPGHAVLTVTPICATGLPSDPAAYIAPAPFERDVKGGDVVSLGAIEVVLQVSSCLEQPCVCHDP